MTIQKCAVKDLLTLSVSSIFGQVHVSSCRGLDFYPKNVNALNILNSFELQEACQEVKVFQSWLFNRDLLLMANIL